MEEKTDILAQRTKHIRPSPTMAITQKAADMRRMGRDVIGLGAGEPDFPTPPHIRAAAVEAMQRGETKYTAVAGTWALRQAIRKKFGKGNGLFYGKRSTIARCDKKYDGVFTPGIMCFWRISGVRFSLCVSTSRTSKEFWYGSTKRSSPRREKCVVWK